MSVHDLRYVKTEELIRKAFLSCCAEHTIEEIHTKDICAKARISRNAFYGHYENKYHSKTIVCTLDSRPRIDLML